VLRGLSARRRNLASIVLAVVGCVLALVGGVALYARSEIFESGVFADHAAETLKDDQVRAALVNPLADEATEKGPDVLINVRPLLVGAAEEAIGSTPFRSVFRKGVRKAYGAIFTKDKEEIALTLGNADVLIKDAVGQVSPQAAERIPDDVGNRFLTLTESDVVLTIVRVSEDVHFLGLLLPPLALICLGGSVAVATDRRRALMFSASGIAVAAAVALIAYLIGRSIVLGQFDDETERDAVAAIWDAFLGGLRSWILGIGLVAILVTAAAAMARERDPLVPARRALVFVTRHPETSWGRAGRAVAVGAVSLLFVFHPTLALQVVAVIVGAYGLFVAACELLGLIAPPEEERKEGARRWIPSPRVAAGGGVIVAVILAAVIVLVTGRGEGERDLSRPSGPVERCNGFAELCDRPLNEVAFPAAHNAMSAAKLPGWYQPNQRYDIRRQLDDGIRAFLIDSHYGVKRSGGPVLTDLEREGTSKVLEGIRAELGPEAASAFQAIDAQYAQRGGEGKSGSYFCHVVCELGSIEMGKTLGWFRDFLETHPDEVLILFIEDKVSPSDTATAFEKSGILHYVHIQKQGEPFPTLRELIETDKRLFVMAEVDAGAGAIPWYHQGFDLAQETPYTFGTPDELAAKASCVPNRGAGNNPLFQLNHWVEKLPRSPSTASEVNSIDFLGRRARQCERRRGLLPNIVAVDYYDKGDVVAASTVLNGLPTDAQPQYRTTD
jgi:hypothetical protein